MKNLLLLALLAAGAMGPSPGRPKILGVAHIALYVHDMDKARAFYTGLLGYREPFRLDNPDGRLSMSFIKVNDRQYIELSPEKAPDTERLSHIAIEVDDAEALRAYLASQGVPVPAAVGKGRIGNSNFNVTDPDGHTLEIVQYEPDGWSRRDAGQFMDGPRISTRMRHLGITVGRLEPALKFYGELLGFRELWRGSRDGKTLSWVNMRVPDGDDYIELMLFDQPPSLAELGVLHHVCLEVADVERAKADLEARPAHKAYTRALETRTGINRKRQLNLFDPDGTRSELMEPGTVDGKPAEPSKAAPPR